MKEIQLTRGYVAIVSDEDFERVMAAGPWHAHHVEHCTVYARRNTYKPDGQRTTQTLHRFILGLTDPKIEVDHEDRNGLHNWRGNLRIASNSQNGANARKYRNGVTSKYRGVGWYKRLRKWIAQIKHNGKTIYLGLFESEVDAALAYDRAARAHHGEFAACNFPEKKPAVSETAQNRPGVIREKEVTA